jgi:hypothetical protein
LACAPAFIALLLVPPQVAGAQQSARMFFIAATPSVGTVPADYLTGCSSGGTEWSAALAVDAGIRTGGFRLTARVGRAGSAHLLSQSVCEAETAVYEDGTHTHAAVPLSEGAG